MCLRKVFLAFFLLFLYQSNVEAIPVSRLSLESDSMRSPVTDINHLEGAKVPSPKKYFFYLGLDNDNFYKPKNLSEIEGTGNDFGETHALMLGGYIKDILKKVEYGINFETALHTNRVKTTSKTKKSNGVTTQEFREITTLSVSYDDHRKNPLYFNYSTGLGLINEKKAIPPLALWQQSGNSGAGGFHRISGHGRRLKNKESGGRTLFGEFSGRVGYLISLERPNITYATVMD